MTEIQFRSMLEDLGFNHYATDDTYSKHYGDTVSGLTADFKKAELDALPKPVKPTPKQKQDLDRKRGEIIARYNLRPYFEKITGIEKEYRLSKVSKVAAFMYGQDDINIIYTDGLLRNDEVKDGTVNLIIANPPYSVKGFLETIPEERRKEFALHEAVAQVSSCNSIECFFVERAAQLLAPGGIAAIILPSSILNNGNIYIACRDILLANFDVVAIVEMGNGTFGKTNTSTATLFLRRKKNDDAEHVRNRVACWFKADFSKDDIFKDADVRTRYAAAIGVDEADYDAFLKGEPTQRLLESDIFKQYREMIVSSSKAKSILKKKLKPNYSAADRENEFEAYVAAEIRRMEAEKLRVFMLADQNSQPVVVVKAPSDNDGIKKFLGYEWSGRKGAEGLHVLGVAESKEDEFKGSRGIDKIVTPLFNPSNLTDSTKIASIIRSNFGQGEIVIAEPLSENVKYISLVEMLDFKRSEFEKKLHTDGLQVFNLVSKWPLDRLDKSVTIIRGVTYEKTDQVLDATGNIVLTADNVTLGGELEISKEVYLRSELEIEEEKRLKKDDCLVCLSSGSREHVGKSALISAEVNGYAGGFMGILRVLPGKMLPKYLHLVLNSAGVRRVVRAKANGPNIKNLTNEIGEIKVPTPPVIEQKKLVAECEKIDKKIAQAKKDLQSLNGSIQEILTTRGGSGKKYNVGNMLKAIVGPTTKIKSSQIRDQGSIPVVSQESGVLISGYVENLDPITDLPIVLFGDHTCEFKYVDFPFVRGADGTQLLKFDPAVVESRYMLYLLRNSAGLHPEKYERHMKYLKDLDVYLPSLSVQTSILSEVQEIEDKIAALKQTIEAAKAARSNLVEDFLK